MKALLTGALLACVALAAPAPAAPKSPTAAQGLQFVDLTDEFDKAWNGTAQLPAERRPLAFEAEMAKSPAGFYDPKRVADYLTEPKYQERVLKGLNAYPEQRPGIQRVSREFQAMIKPAQRSFERAFGPMRGYPPIYLVVSFGEFDGGTRDLPEGNRLMFGADMIDRLHKNKPLQPFFHHELFHLLHARTFHGCEQVWCSLWSEGLAVYVASKLNPLADDDALLLDMPRPLRSAVEEQKTAAVCAVRERLNSTAKADYAPLFMMGGKNLEPQLPPRFGYYVGYLVAQDLGRTRTLRQLARMPNDQVKPLLEASLARMSTCPPPAI
jgi:hypothetical protein